MLNNKDIKDQFSPLKQRHNGYNYAYLDNGATTHKPQSVIDRIYQFYTNENATVHRGIYEQSQKATELCDAVRKQVKTFINAKEEEEIIFVKGTTDALNLVASILTEGLLKEGDEILISEMEHHANIIPWQDAARKSKASLKVCPITESGEIDTNAFEKLLTKKVKICSFVHVSNVLGTHNPIKDLTKKAKEKDALVIVDGAQAIAHTHVDMQELGCDFYCFSGHKMYGPTGIGILYGKKELLNALPHYQSGGDMIEEVDFEKSIIAKAPYKFEAGTPAIAEIIGLGESINFLTQIGFKRIEEIETELGAYLHKRLQEIEDITIYGTAPHKAALAAFNIQNLHPLDIGSILDKQGVAVRVGHHCAQPLHKKLGIASSLRASLAIYNTKEDIDQLITGLKKAIELLK